MLGTCRVVRRSGRGPNLVLAGWPSILGIGDWSVGRGGVGVWSEVGKCIDGGVGIYEILGAYERVVGLAESERLVEEDDLSVAEVLLGLWPMRLRDIVGGSMVAIVDGGGIERRGEVWSA